MQRGSPDAVPPPPAASMQQINVTVWDGGANWEREESLIKAAVEEKVCADFLNHPREERKWREVSSLSNCSLFFCCLFFINTGNYWTIERLCRGPLRRRQIKYVDGSDDNPEGIQARNGNEWRAFNHAVGPDWKNVNGGQCSLAFSGEGKKQNTPFNIFLVVEDEAKQLHSRPKDPFSACLK